MGHQSARATTQVDGRALAQPHHGAVEPFVGVSAAEPTAHGKPVEPAVVVAKPAPLTVKGPVVEVTEHARRPGWRGRTGCRARSPAGPRRHHRPCPHPPGWEPG